MNTAVIILLIVIAFVCTIVGIIGSVVPGLPGPPVSWLGLLLLSFIPYVNISAALLITTAAIAIVITVMDYVVPSTFTKRFGGTKMGIWGCNIGLIISIIGLPFGPTGLLGIIFWPFIGAFIGEMIAQKNTSPALKAALGAFVGFLTGTLAKFVYCITLTVFMIIQCVKMI